MSVHIRFFRNTGAVAGVFVLVGLAVISILLWLFFALRRRRLGQRLEREATAQISSTTPRPPLDDGDDDDDGQRHMSFASHSLEMGQRRSSSGLGMSTAPSSRASPFGFGQHAAQPSVEAFHPYADYPVPAGAYAGYVPARTASPPTLADLPREGSSGSGHTQPGHSASGSHEPLLASDHTPPPLPPAYPTRAPTPPTRSALRLPEKQPIVLAPPPAFDARAGDRSSAVSSVYSEGSLLDDRLDPGLRPRLRPGAESFTTTDLRDENDYSRPVLGVRLTFLRVDAELIDLLARSAICPKEPAPLHYKT